MSTVIKDNFYIKYKGESDEDLTHGKIYPVETIKVAESYFGLDWPRMYAEFYVSEYSGIFDREVGDPNFVVVREDFWLIQELGSVPEKGQVVEYMGLNFPFYDVESALTLMKLARGVRFAK